MNEEYLIAYSIVNAVATKLNTPMCVILRPKTFGGVRSYKNPFQDITFKRAICIHRILIEAGLTLKQTAIMFGITNHSTTIYYRTMYEDQLIINRNFKKMVRLAA